MKNRTTKKNQEEEEKMKGKSVQEVSKLLISLGIEAEGLMKAWQKSEVRLPACAQEALEGGCLGCEVSGGLYLQCTKPVKKEGMCTVCYRSCQSGNRPKNGLWSERVDVPQERFTDGVWKNEEGRQAMPWLQYLLNMGLSKEDGEEILRERGIDSLPDKEWEEKPKARPGRRASTVSDTSSEGGEKRVPRFIPLEGKRKSPPKDQAHKGKNGAMLRVYLTKSTREVRKANPSNWTDEANAKFAEMYCNGDMEATVGEDFGKATKKKKNDAAQDQLAALQAKLAAAEAKLQAVEESKSVPPAPQVDAPSKTEVPSAEEKKAKKEALKKAREEKKKKAEDEKKKKVEESKRQQAELMAKLAALQEAENEELSEAEQEDEELGEFDDSDDEGQDFNPYEHNGVTYHRDESDQLYTADGDFWGHINKEGKVVDGEPTEE